MGRQGSYSGELLVVVPVVDPAHASDVEVVHRENDALVGKSLRRSPCTAEDTKRLSPRGPSWFGAPTRPPATGNLGTDSRPVVRQQQGLALDRSPSFSARRWLS